LYLGQHIIERPRNPFRRGDIELVAQLRGEGYIEAELLGVGDIVDPVREGHRPPTDLNTGTGFRDGLIGQEHEFLDKLMGFLALLDFHPYGKSVLVQAESYLLGREIDGPRSNA